MLSLEKTFLGGAWGSWAAQHPPEYFAKGSGWRARHMYSAVQSGRPWTTKPSLRPKQLKPEAHRLNPQCKHFTCVFRIQAQLLAWLLALAPAEVTQAFSALACSELKLGASAL